MKDFGIAVAWHNIEQIWSFLAAWGLVGVDEKPDEKRVVEAMPDWLYLQRDVSREGGAKTKNKAMRRAAVDCDVVVSMDDDCYPTLAGQSLTEFALLHSKALQPQRVRMFETVTDPPSRGTPFEELDMLMPVAASMGFWTEVGDYCGPRQLAFGGSRPKTMQFRPQTVFRRYFPLCAMNYAFRPKDWQPFFYLVEGVGRFDDIWMGWMWQRAAYDRGFCFNLNGPNVRHVRQSNVWKNLRVETTLIETSETIWRTIASSSQSDYDSLFSIVQPHVGQDSRDYAAEKRP